MKKYSIIIFFLTIVLLIPCSARENEIIIVLNKEVPYDTENPIQKKMIRNIFLGNKTLWDNGKKIVIVIQKKGKTHESFTKDILGIAPEKLGRLWKRAFFAGTGNLPKICDSEDELITIIKNNPGAIGYIDLNTKYTDIKGVKISDMD
jgi:ABC-type phosphate transport system substrate-binding protein